MKGGYTRDISLGDHSSTFGVFHFDTYLWRNLEKSHVQQSIKAQEKITPHNVYSHMEPTIVVPPNSPTHIGTIESHTSQRVNDEKPSVVNDSLQTSTQQDLVSLVPSDKDSMIHHTVASGASFDIITGVVKGESVSFSWPAPTPLPARLCCCARFCSVLLRDGKLLLRKAKSELAMQELGLRRNDQLQGGNPPNWDTNNLSNELNKVGPASCEPPADDFKCILADMPTQTPHSPQDGIHDSVGPVRTDIPADGARLAPPGGNQPSTSQGLDGGTIPEIPIEVHPTRYSLPPPYMSYATPDDIPNSTVGSSSVFSS